MINYDDLKKVDIEQLKRVDLGSNLRFDDVLPYVQKIIKILLSFERRESDLTSGEKQSVVSIFNRLSNYLMQIRDFETQSNESVESTRNRKSELIKQIQGLIMETNEKILALSLSLNSNDKQINQIVIDAQNKIIEVNNKLQGFDNLFNTKNGQFDAKITQANELIQELRHTKAEIENSSIDSVVSKYGTIFEEQATSNKKVAMWSLGIFITSIVALLIATYYLFNPILQEVKQIADPNTRIEYVILQSVFRIILLGISFVFAKESLKNYNINMHLYNLNRHRQNSLKSFQTLISATQTSTMRDHIINEIAQTIYSNKEDGYIQADNKKISLAEITELIKVLR